MTISSDSPNSDQNYSAGSLTRVYIPVSATRENKLVEWGLVHADQDGTLKADAVDVTAVIKDAVITPQKLNSRTRLGWIDNELSAVSTVTHNGNRSYDAVFASTVASILSEGMRLEFTKTTAGNAYMGGAFNGSSHYFTKTAPLNGTLGTVNNNFTIEAVVQPTAYSFSIICGRVDATATNAFRLGMTATGQIEVLAINGSGNSRYYLTYQSLPLNKKTHVAASWASGTVVVYFDGVSVPIGPAIVGGTAPTTAGTGGDWSIGRNGAFAGQYFPGYISNVAVFDAVLSASTIKDHYTKKLTGSETNCIGAWSLDNSSSDQSSAGNNLTATGGVGYTAMSPHGQLGNGVETTKAVGLVTNVNGTTVTVQCPEGVTIPSGSSTISSVAYSTQANPFGWVSDKGRWEVGSYYRSAVNNSVAASNYENIASAKVYKPTGAFTLTANAGFYGTTGATHIYNIHTAAAAAADASMTQRASSGGAFHGKLDLANITLPSTANTYYLNCYTSSGATTLILTGQETRTALVLTPSNL